MKTPVWFDAVDAANLDVNAPGVEWSIVPIITETLLHSEATIGCYIDDVLADRHNTVTKAVSKMIRAETTRHAAAQAAIEMSGIVQDLRQMVRREVEQQRDTLFDTYLQVRADIAEANAVDQQIRERKESAA